MGIVKLEGVGGVLVLGPDDWCSVAFECDGELVLLGADAFVPLAGRLLAALLEPLGGPSGTIEGESVSWVATLAEKHASLYAAEHGDGWKIFVQDAQGRNVGTLIVPADTAKAWTSKLQGELATRE